MQEQPTNPETERHRQLLIKHHQRTRIDGIGLFISSFILLVTGALIIILAFLNNKANLVNPIILFSTPLLGLTGLVAGLRMYQEGKQPPNRREIDQSRQQERTEHFHIAQGKLPWYYSKTLRICATILALLFIIGGVELTLTNHPEIITQGILDIAGGFLILYIVHIMLPRMKRELPEESRRMLKNSLTESEGIEEPPQE